MPIWSAEIKELEKLYESIKGQLPDLEKELERLVKADDENMILLYSRRCLEVIITDLCECELKRERGTEPLKGVIDKLNKEKKVPAHIASSMYGLNELSTYGAHPKDFDPEQVKPVLINLDIIIKWYFKYKQLATIGRTEVVEETIKLKEGTLEDANKEERKEVQKRPTKLIKDKFFSGIAILAIIIAAILMYPKIFKQSTLEKLRSTGERISLAVMPFQNMTNDTNWNIWQNIIQANLINSLSNAEYLKVRQIESVNNQIEGKEVNNYASLSPASAGKISQKLNADVFIYGNIQKVALFVRIDAQLVDTKSGEVFKSFKLERPFNGEDMPYYIDSLAIRIKNFLEILKLKDESPIAIVQYASTTDSPEAFRYFLIGKKSFEKRDYPTARNFLSQALSLDSNFFYANTLLAMSFGNVGLYDKAKRIALNLYNKRNQKPLQQKIYSNYLYALYFETNQDRINNLVQLVEIDDKVPNYHWLLGNAYLDNYQYDKAINEYEKSLEIYKKWDSKPWWIYHYTNPGLAYHKTGQYRKESKLYRKAELDFPDDPDLIYRQAVLALAQNDMKAANIYIKKYLSVLKNNSTSDADMAQSLGDIYFEAEIPEEAEKDYRDALSLEPDNPDRMNTLAYFLINKDRNIIEGLELANKVLEKSPDNYNYLHTKGWGLYKQGKYKEALEILQKSWVLRREKAVYDHEAFLHLEAAKKAVANLKNN